MLNVDTFWFLIKGSGKVCNFDLYRPIQAVDFGRWQSIEGEIDRRRSIVGEKGKKKKKRKRRKKKRGEEEPTFHVTSLFALRCRPRLRALFLPCGERAGEDVVDCGRKREEEEEKKKQKEEPTFHATSSFTCCRHPRPRALFLPRRETFGDVLARIPSPPLPAGAFSLVRGDGRSPRAGRKIEATAVLSVPVFYRTASIVVFIEHTFSWFFRGIRAGKSFSFLEVIVGCEFQKNEEDSKIEDDYGTDDKKIYLHLKKFFRGTRFTYQPFLKSIQSKYNEGDCVNVSGKVSWTWILCVKKMLAEGHYEMTEYIIGNLDKEDQDANEQRMPYPFYPSKAGMKPNFLADIISRSADS
ncbi:hypothetical protein BHE74_00025044 [Ensete ventricosum]|nr:hypothetical protein BHE74_00025044 [Ensete ventricosum]RZR87903.1 hypothetical protein BHM03_00015368 [Ensete ventricosum]